MKNLNDQSIKALSELERCYFNNEVKYQKRQDLYTAIILGCGLFALLMVIILIIF